ncbi:hypothetical protein B5S33_g881 [[Candida] boidinii]|nr:hypothetical protein B5S33_g881 [[Candida] boidinii]
MVIKQQSSVNAIVQIAVYSVFLVSTVLGLAIATGFPKREITKSKKINRNLIFTILFIVLIICCIRIINGRIALVHENNDLNSDELTVTIFFEFLGNALYLLIYSLISKFLQLSNSSRRRIMRRSRGSKSSRSRSGRKNEGQETLHKSKSFKVKIIYNIPWFLSLVTLMSGVVLSIAGAATYRKADLGKYQWESNLPPDTIFKTPAQASKYAYYMKTIKIFKTFGSLYFVTFFIIFFQLMIDLNIKNTKINKALIIFTVFPILPFLFLRTLFSLFESIEEIDTPSWSITGTSQTACAHYGGMELFPEILIFIGIQIFLFFYSNPRFLKKFGLTLYFPKGIDLEKVSKKRKSNFKTRNIKENNFGIDADPFADADPLADPFDDSLSKFSNPYNSPSLLSVDLGNLSDSVLSKDSYLDTFDTHSIPT